jgi:serine/threonine-protein kinase PpkA
MIVFPQIAGYRITRLIGQGGMARVYAAVEAELEREVAIKVVSLSGAPASALISAAKAEQDQDFSSRLEFEARSLARLRHPNIVELYRFGRLSHPEVGAPALYYVMPLLTGGDLGHWLKPAPEVKVHALLADLLDALGHAHEAGIVHRDVKPENILFDQHGRPQLADFGAAFALDCASTTSRLTQEGFAVGSLGYMSPEQARGQAISGASDLYSLGVVAFELLTDTRSHSGSDAVAIALAQIELPPASLPLGLSHWQTFFATALDPNPHKRFASAAAMKAALPVLRDGAIDSGDKTVFQRMAPYVPNDGVGQVTRVLAIKTAQPNPTKPLLLMCLGLSAALLIGYGFYSWKMQVQRAQQAQFETLRFALSRAPEGGEQALLQQADAVLAVANVRMLAAAAMARKLVSLKSLAQREGNASANLSALTQPWLDIDRLRTRYQIARSPALTQLESDLTHRVQETLVLAAEQFDRTTALQVLPLAQALARSQTALAPIIRLATAIPEIGGTYQDQSGILLRLIRAPNGNTPGLAVMANALTQDQFVGYATTQKLEVAACNGAAANSTVRGCMDQTMGKAIARWLSGRSSAEFTLPSSTQWQAAHALAPVLKSHFAASRECRVVTYSQRPNVVKRTWGGIKSVFGGQKAQPTNTQFCGGELVFALDGSGKSAVASTTNTVLVLVVVLGRNTG